MFFFGENLNVEQNLRVQKVKGDFMKHFLDTNNLSLEEINKLMEDAQKFENNKPYAFKQQGYVCNAFFEPSTRTSMSFAMAEHKMNLKLIEFDAGNSSLTKGETLLDTVKTLDAIGTHAMVIRHPEYDYYTRLLGGGFNMSLINAGSGSGQHPSQSLLDIYTIKKEFGGFKGLKALIAGDVVHSRVANSNIDMLTRLGVEVFVASDTHLMGNNQYNQVKIDEIIDQVDVAMFLRVQRERHEKNMLMTREEYHQAFGLTIEREKRMRKNSIIMHPAPVNRDVEIADALVECKRSRIFPQMRNGVFARMAILRNVLEPVLGGGFKDEV